MSALCQKRALLVGRSRVFGKVVHLARRGLLCYTDIRYERDHGMNGMNTIVETLTGRERVTRVCKYFVRRVLFPVAVLCPFAYFFQKIAILYLACGAYDVSRNNELNPTTLRRYFIGNGFGTWLLSPSKTLLALLSLPYINRGVYRLEDLPPSYREEVERLITIAKD